MTLAQAKQAIIAEIDARLKPNRLHKMVTRAKTNTMTSLIYSQDSISGQAQMIGSLNSIGLDDRMVFNLPSR